MGFLEEYNELPNEVSGWMLTEESKEVGPPGGNYEHPFKERVFINIYRPDLVSRPSLWKSKYNDHLNNSEDISISEDYTEVVSKAVKYMENNPASKNREGDKGMSSWM